MIVKQMLMSAVEMRDQVHQLVDEIDERLLKAVFLMMSSYQKEEVPNLVYQAGEPVTTEALKAKISVAEAQIDRGEYLTPAQLRQEAEQWLSESIK